MLITTCCNIGEVAVCAKFHQRSKPMKYVLGDSRCRLNFILQLVEVGVEYNIGLPLLVHVARVPQRTKLRGYSSQAMKAMSMRNQLKWNSYPWSCAPLQSISNWFTRLCAQFICSPLVHFLARSTMKPVTCVGFFL
jgi:hypothetical protein